MAQQNSKVIHCPITALEERMNALEGNWAILMQHWYEKSDGVWVVLVLGRGPDGSPIAMPLPNNFRPR